MPSVLIQLPNAALCQQTIQANVSLFVDGTIIQGRTIRSWFNVPELSLRRLSTAPAEAQAHMFTMLSIQNRFNKLLRPRGLVLRKRRDTYLVCGNVAALRKADEYVTVADRNSEQFATLRNGVHRYQSVWSPLTPAEIAAATASLRR